MITGGQMRARLIEEAGYLPAIFGLGLSHNKTTRDEYHSTEWAKEHMAEVAKRLAFKDGGHNKFLESITIWLDVDAPRYWWQEADTYRLTSKQSASTMHTITKSNISPLNFEDDIPRHILMELNWYIKNQDWQKAKSILPESFLQRRIWKLDYKTLRNIILQRRNHKLKLWQQFIKEVLAQIKHPELLPGLKD